MKVSPISIAMVGKYVTLADSYVSVNHALKHAASSIGKENCQLTGLIQRILMGMWIHYQSMTEY